MPIRHNLSALVFLGVSLSPVAQAEEDPFDCESYTIDWSGTWRTTNSSGPDWYGEMNLSVAEDGTLTGCGDFHNDAKNLELGVYYQGWELTNGSIIALTHIADGDLVLMRSLESWKEADSWTIHFTLAGWPTHDGWATLYPSPAQ